MAFQIKDDLLDADKEESTSFLKFISFEETESYLQKLTEEIQNDRKKLGLSHAALDELISFNLNRNL